jgi:hypothetical protein
MGRRHTVSDLPPDQIDFVVRSIIGGLTNREISAGFAKQFPGKRLSKSALNRWQKASGHELVERYQFARCQAKEILEGLKLEPEADKFQVIIGDLENRLLISAREVIAADPVRMMKIRLDEENRRLKSRELDLKEKQLELELAKAKAIDPAAMPNQVLEYLLEFIGDDAAGLRWFSAKSKSLEQFLTRKYAA